MRHTFAPSPLIDMAGQDEGAGPAPVEQFFETVELEDGKLHLQVMRLRKQVIRASVVCLAPSDQR